MQVVWVLTNALLGSLPLPGFWDGTCGVEATESWGKLEGYIYESKGHSMPHSFILGVTFSCWFRFLLPPWQLLRICIDTWSDPYWFTLPKTNQLVSQDTHLYLLWVLEPAVFGINFSFQPLFGTEAWCFLAKQELPVKMPGQLCELQEMVNRGSTRKGKWERSAVGWEQGMHFPPLLAHGNAEIAVMCCLNQINIYSAWNFWRNKNDREAVSDMNKQRNT